MKLRERMTIGLVLLEELINLKKRNNINGKIEGVRKILGIKTDFFKSVFIFLLIEYRQY